MRSCARHDDACCAADARPHVGQSRHDRVASTLFDYTEGGCEKINVTYFQLKGALHAIIEQQHNIMLLSI